jgi:hypothetical protein
MNQINLGSVKMPMNAATKTFAILAKRGAGKTYTAAVMAEEFAKNNIPFVVIDPIDVWWGLRLGANGKDKGLPVVVFGVQHEDILLNRDMGRKIAQAVVKENVSCVINTFGLPKVAQRHLLAEFADELLNINNSPRHIFIEEAHEFLPQRVFGGLGVVFNAVSNLVVMGRNRGIGVTLINQRAATINKDVLTQLDTLLAFQNTSPQDRKALADWVEYHSAEGDFDKFMQSLPFLPKGEGWIWSPEFMGVFEKIKIRKRETFHPDREKLGTDFVMPELDQIDIQGFISKFSEANNSIKKEEKKSDIGKSAEEMIDVVEQLTIREIKNQYESQLIIKESEINDLKKVIQQIGNIIGTMKNDGISIDQPVVVSNGGVELWKRRLGNGLSGRLLKFFADNPTREFNREQACLAIGVPSKAGHTTNEWGKLLRTSAVVKNGSMYRLNPNL